MTTDFAALERATAELDPPFAVVDMAAFRANAAAMVERAGGKPIRVASKSVRARELIRAALDVPGYAGVLAFTLREALWLAGDTGAGVGATASGGAAGPDAAGRGAGGRGAGGPGDAVPVAEDVVVAYPDMDRGALRRLAGDERLAARVTLMIDSTEQLDAIVAALAGGAAALPSGGGAALDGAAIRVCLDVDASLRLLGGRVHIGARRSPVRTPTQARALAEAVAKRPEFRLVGVMSYEAQIAGVGDDPPGARLRGLGVRGMRRISVRELRERRAAVIAAVREVADLEFVNGGGTGSLELTTAEDAVTELTAGSGLYQPALFDAYRSFSGRPAAYFALPVTRRPGPGVVTVHGGGWVASGAAGADRLPVPAWPRGLTLTGMEGAGEVQTPLTGAAAGRLRVGDRVWFRHAKAGELAEHVNELHLVEDGRVTEVVPTYRGEGHAFL